jgi:hypothetical protein
MHVYQQIPEGTTVGEYEITGFLGEGTYGTVYAAYHPVIGKRAAVKVLKHDAAADSELVQRFKGEALAVNAIEHPNIVDIFGFGHLPDGRPYLIMEFLQDAQEALQYALGFQPEHAEALALQEEIREEIANRDRFQALQAAAREDVLAEAKEAYASIPPASYYAEVAQTEFDMLVERWLEAQTNELKSLLDKKKCDQAKDQREHIVALVEAAEAPLQELFKGAKCRTGASGGSGRKQGHKAEAPAPIPVPAGTLMLNSKPVCRIAIDGRDTGKNTPQRKLTLSAGQHQITLINKDFAIHESFTVTIKAGETVKRIKDLSDRIK